MNQGIDSTPLSELRRNALAALLVLVAIGLGALLFVSLMDIW
jgi:hypothetical protein